MGQKSIDVGQYPDKVVANLLICAYQTAEHRLLHAQNGDVCIGFNAHGHAVVLAEDKGRGHEVTLTQSAHLNLSARQ